MPVAQSVSLADTIETQSAQLTDSRLHIVSRRDLARRIGQVQGNRHLQKVVAFARSDSQTPIGPDVASDIDEGAAARDISDAPSPASRIDTPDTLPVARSGTPNRTDASVTANTWPASIHVLRALASGIPAGRGPADDGHGGSPQERSPEADESVGREAQTLPRNEARAAPADEGGVAAEGGSGPARITTTSGAAEVPRARGTPAVAGAAEPVQADRGSAAGPGMGAEPGVSPAVAPGPAINSSSGEDLLASIAASPVSSLGEALGHAKALAPELQQREKAQAQAGIPAIDQPTGLPARAPQAPPAPTTLPQGHNALPPPAAGRATAEPPRQPEPTGPLPASQVSTAASEPKDTQSEGGGSWWNWLTGRLQGFFGSLPTRDPTVSTSAGPPQRVDMSGEADPAQNATQQQAAEQQAASQRGAADAATHADFGENAVYPTVPVGKLRPRYKPTLPPRPAGKAVKSDAVLPGKERAEFDRSAKPWLDEQVHGQLGAYGKERSTYERATEEAQQAGKRQLDDETKRTRSEQEALCKEVRADVAAERGRWQEENRKVHEQLGNQSSAKREEVDRQIREKVATTHGDADSQLRDAETKAEAEKSKSEQEAADKKREEEDKPRSWWDRVKGAVSDAFNAIRSAVNAIFDKLRQVVKGIIDAARRAVHALIEACRAAIVGMIHAFGEFVKGLVSVALAAFPELAKKARAWIDGKVKAASDAVNRAAEALHRAADAILDVVAKAIDLALGLLQAALIKAIDALETLALLPFKAMETIAKLVEWVAKYGKFITGALDLEGAADRVIEGLKKSLGAMVSEVPAKALAKLQELAGQLGGDSSMAQSAPAPAAAAPASGASLRVQRQSAVPVPVKRHVSASEHLKGVLRYLDKGLEHLKTSWWDELKKVGWNLLWPWPAVWSDLKDIWKQIKAGFDDAYHLRASKVIDDILAIDQKINSILGNLYGWFFIASVLVGSIIGAFFGGAGAIPGALAGAALAGEAGEALVAALIATESAVIVKAVADLAIGNDKAEEDEQDYSKIAGSTLTVTITAAMMLIGEIAAKLAKSVWEGGAGVFRGEKGPEVSVDGGGAGDVKPSDAAPGAEGGGRALAEAPTADGATIKALEDGRIVICRMCEISDLAKEFAAELDDPARASDPDIQNLKREIDNAKTLDPDSKVKAEVELRAKLEKLRAESSIESKATPPKTADPLHGRTQEQFDALASDPAHGGKIDPKSMQERRVGLDLEARGEVPGPLTRDPTGGAEFIDSVGQKWDVKGFNSNFTPKKGGFDLIRDAGKVDKSLALGENVMLDTSKMSPTDVQALRAEGTQRGWGNRVKWWP